ncbi:MAG: right-handed parallel beta-helix repeat-containing protein [Acidimicrobiia bacterium]|nr:right-handed parallel beta-helix repeat-containing protein [Acidimicrobiia bacterium]
MRVRGLAAAVLLVALLIPGPARAGPGGDSVGIVDPGTARWTVRTPTGEEHSFYFGIPGDIPLVGDWDCDGRDTPGMFRPHNGNVYLRNSLTTGVADSQFFFGKGGDVPLVGDWDGDGCDTIGVFRNGRVFIRNSLGTGFADHDFYFGIPGDVPLGGDYSGSGTSSAALFRPAAGQMHIRHSLTTGIAEETFDLGQPGDRAIVGDWDGDGVTTTGVLQHNGTFSLANQNDGSGPDLEIPFADGIPIAGAFGLTAGWDPTTFAHRYEVGPGRPYAQPGDVPWESLQPSSIVRIHYRAEPYRSKFVVNTVGTATAPVVITGVPDAEGRLPRISGDGAVTRPQLNYWNEVRSIIKIGGSNLPTDDLTPAHIYIENLDIASAKPGYAFTDDSGNVQIYSNNAACIHVERGAHVTLRGNELHDCGNGVFTGFGSSDVVLAGNYIWGNGIAGRFYEHNTYTESDGITFEYNRYGPLCDGCLGNNLKDRSAGTVIRYNWIEGGNRQLDLVETSHVPLRDDPAYRTTFVYGNVLIEPDGAGNSQIIHYGGDGGDATLYRKGTLHLYHNTIVSTRSGNTTLLRLSTDDESADVRNNIVRATAGSGRLAISNEAGTAALRTNWLQAGWVPSHGSLTGTVSASGTITGTDPGFAAGYRLSPASPSAVAGGPLAPAASTQPVEHQYVVHAGAAWRSNLGLAALGAFD